MTPWTRILLVACAGVVACSGGASGDGGSGGSPTDGGLGGGTSTDGGVDASPGDAALDAESCAPAAPHSFAASLNEELLNPARGFHDFVDLTSNDDFTGVRAAGRTLAYAGVSLLDYVDAPIPPAFIQKLDAGFVRVRSAKIKVVLRFVYRNDFGDPNDAPLSRILEHIATLAPLLVKHADVIAALEAGFIGPWGEWHSSSNGLDQDAKAKKAVLDALLAAAPDVPVLVRRWSFKSEHAGGPVTEAQAFGASAVARIGHHNDCFLSSDDDVGTYPAGQMAEWKAKLSADTRFVPIGGETCADYAPRTNCATAVPEMAELHFTFLNALYHPDALARFQQEGCYQSIAERLGYRLRLKNASFPESARPGCAFDLSVELENDGFAAPYAARDLFFVLDGPQRFVSALATEPRRFEPGESAFETSVQLPADLPAGTYRLALWLPDASPTLRDIPEYSIRLVGPEWDPAAGLNVLAGSIQVAP